MQNFVMLTPTVKALQFFNRDGKQKVSSDILIERRINCIKSLEKTMLYTKIKVTLVVQV